MLAIRNDKVISFVRHESIRTGASHNYGMLVTRVSVLSVLVRVAIVVRLIGFSRRSGSAR